MWTDANLPLFPAVQEHSRYEIPLHTGRRDSQNQGSPFSLKLSFICFPHSFFSPPWDHETTNGAVVTPKAEPPCRWERQWGMRVGWGWDVSSPFPHTTLNTTRRVSMHENRSEIRVFMEFTQTSGNTHAEERQVREGRDFKHPTSAAGHWEMWEMMSPSTSRTPLPCRGGASRAETHL